MIERPNFLFFKEENWSSSHPLAKPYPPEWYQDKLWPIMKVMDRIRLAAGVPLFVTPNGGYRCDAHNRAVGGKPASEHRNGFATDFTARGAIKNDELYTIVLRLYQGGALEQALKEIGSNNPVSGIGVYDTFVHIDIGATTRPDGTPRRWDERNNTRRRQIP